jgi:hypothetical protein
MGGAITYRKHWIILLKKVFLSLVGMLLSIAFIIALVTRNITGINYGMAITLASFLMFSCFLIMTYQYVDWRNDIFQLTPNQVIDLDRKPFGRESRRAAPLENILSIEYERAVSFNVVQFWHSIYHRRHTQLNTQLRPSTFQSPAGYSLVGLASTPRRRKDRQILQERDRSHNGSRSFRKNRRLCWQAKMLPLSLNPPPG